MSVAYLHWTWTNKQTVWVQISSSTLNFLTHRIKQYPTSHIMTGVVRMNHNVIQVCVFTAMLVVGRENEGWLLREIDRGGMLVRKSEFGNLLSRSCDIFVSVFSVFSLSSFLPTSPFLPKYISLQYACLVLAFITSVVPELAKCCLYLC